MFRLSARTAPPVVVAFFSLLCFLMQTDPVWSQEEPSISSGRFQKVMTIAGNGAADGYSERGPALNTPLTNPFGIQPERDGSLIIASFDQHVIYRLDPSYRRLEVIAGTGSKGLSGRDGDRPTQISLHAPHEIQVDDAGNIYIADTSNHRVGMIEASTGRWRIVAGTGEAGFAGDGGPANRAAMNQAYSIAIDDRSLFIADLKNHRIREVDLDKGIIRTICGNGEKALPSEGAPAMGQPLMGPRSLAVDADNLWIVMREGNSVWRIDRHEHRIYHVAGSGKKGFTGDGGDPRLATFAGPKGITVDPGVALFIADTENHAIRRIDLLDQVVTTVIGTSGQAGFDGDGDGVVERQLARPHGVCLLDNGDLLIGDSENHRVRLLRE